MVLAIVVGMTSGRTLAEDRLVYSDQPPEGFDVVRFTRRVVLEDFLVRNDAYIQPGATFVNDRVIAADGTRLYCGPISTNGEGALTTWCFAFDGRSFRSALGTTLGRPVALPEGSFISGKRRMD